MTSQKTDWGTLAIAITFGIAVGAAGGLLGVAARLPTAVVAPVTGAIIGGLVPLIYRWRTKRRSN